MIKTFTVEEQFSDMRIDRFIKKAIKDIPQGLIEKSLRNGKIKLNNKKVKSSQRVKIKDKLIFYNLNFHEGVSKNKKLFQPTNKIIKSKKN